MKAPPAFLKMATPSAVNDSLRRRKVRCRNLDPLRFVIKNIKEGKVDECLKLLKDSPRLETLFAERVRLPRVPKGQSPLVLAAQFNRQHALIHILDNYTANMEQETSTDIEGGHPVEGATPLWTASTLGHLDIVKELVKRGADIEHTTDSHSSPLRGAAFDGHLTVVQFLIEKGADIDKPNQVGQSPLTIAAAMKKIDTVKFLLEKGANIHHRGHNGDTPLHVAVESGSKQVTELLVNAGAQNIPNDIGYTPAIMACCYGHKSIMNYLNEKFKLGTQELYDCYCLLVAKEVLNADMTSATEWLLKSVTLREAHSEIQTGLPSSVDIYDNVSEPVDEASAISIINDELKSFYLCSVYCERILGAIHPTTPFYIRISGDMALEKCQYDKCMRLWLRSLEFDRAARMAYELQIIEDILFSVRGFCTMINGGYIPQLHQHFDWGMKEFRQAKESKIDENDVVFCLCRLLAVWLMAIDHVTEKSQKMREKDKLLSSVKLLCSVMEGKECPLLIACLRNISARSKAGPAATSVASSKLPLHRVVILLIENGCPINCEDSMGNFPLHLACQLREDSSFECVKTLVEYGAHLDAVNHCNETSLQIAQKKIGYTKNCTQILEYLTKARLEGMTLQCLSAVALIQEGIPYMEILPSFLISFVAEHETDGQETTNTSSGFSPELTDSTASSDNDDFWDYT